MMLSGSKRKAGPPAADTAGDTSRIAGAVPGSSGGGGGDRNRVVAAANNDPGDDGDASVQQEDRQQENNNSATTAGAIGFVQIRSLGLVTGRICSYLTVSDRYRLRHTDHWSLTNTESVVQSVIGVYGSSNLELRAAFDKVREYATFQGTPDSLNISYGVPDCWDDLLEDEYAENDLWSQLVLPHYNEETGLYNLAELEGRVARLQGDGDEEEEQEQQQQQQQQQQQEEGDILDDHRLLHGLRAVNLFRGAMREKLAKVGADIEELLSASTARYNALFELMEKHGVPVQRFLDAEYPFYGQDIGDAGYEIVQDGDHSFLQHLRPGRKLMLPGEDGDVEEGIMKRCETCKQICDDVQTEHCGNVIGTVHCIDTVCVCRDCSTKTTCSSCGEARCNQPACCSFESCSIPGCTSKFCSPHGQKWGHLLPHTAVWDGQSCGYMLPPNDGTLFCHVSNQGQRFCLAHKPDGAVPIPPFVVEMRRAVNEPEPN